MPVAIWKIANGLVWPGYREAVGDKARNIDWRPVIKDFECQGEGFGHRGAVEDFARG